MGTLAEFFAKKKKELEKQLATARQELEAARPKLQAASQRLEQVGQELATLPKIDLAAFPAKKMRDLYGIEVTATGVEINHRDVRKRLSTRFLRAFSGQQSWNGSGLHPEVSGLEELQKLYHPAEVLLYSALCRLVKGKLSTVGLRKHIALAQRMIATQKKIKRWNDNAKQMVRLWQVLVRVLEAAISFLREAFGRLRSDFRAHRKKIASQKKTLGAEQEKLLARQAGLQRQVDLLESRVSRLSWEAEQAGESGRVLDRLGKDRERYKAEVKELDAVAKPKKLAEACAGLQEQARKKLSTAITTVVKAAVKNASESNPMKWCQMGWLIGNEARDEAVAVSCYLDKKYPVQGDHAGWIKAQMTEASRRYRKEIPGLLAEARPYENCTVEKCADCPARLAHGNLLFEVDKYYQTLDHENSYAHIEAMGKHALDFVADQFRFCSEFNYYRPGDRKALWHRDRERFLRNIGKIRYTRAVARYLERLPAHLAKRENEARNSENEKKIYYTSVTYGADTFPSGLSKDEFALIEVRSPTSYQAGDVLFASDYLEFLEDPVDRLRLMLVKLHEVAARQAENDDEPVTFLSTVTEYEALGDNLLKHDALNPLAANDELRHETRTGLTLLLFSLVRHAHPGAEALAVWEKLGQSKTLFDEQERKDNARQAKHARELQKLLEDIRKALRSHLDEEGEAEIARIFATLVRAPSKGLTKLQGLVKKLIPLVAKRLDNLLDVDELPVAEGIDVGFGVFAIGMAVYSFVSRILDDAKETSFVEFTSKSFLDVMTVIGCLDNVIMKSCEMVKKWPSWLATESRRMTAQLVFRFAGIIADAGLLLFDVLDFLEVYSAGNDKLATVGLGTALSSACLLAGTTSLMLGWGAAAVLTGIGIHLLVWSALGGLLFAYTIKREETTVLWFDTLGALDIRDGQAALSWFQEEELWVRFMEKDRHDFDDEIAYDGSTKPFLIKTVPRSDVDDEHWLRYEHRFDMASLAPGIDRELEDDEEIDLYLLVYRTDSLNAPWHSKWHRCRVKKSASSCTLEKLEQGTAGIDLRGQLEVPEVEIDSWEFKQGASVCFAGATRVLMADGQQRQIAGLRPGDRVYAFDVDENRLVVRPVTRLHAHPATDLLRMDFADGTELLLTSNHPIYTGGRFREAGELRIGEGVRWLDPGSQEMVTLRLEAIGDGGCEPVFNITVEGCHTYFAQGILVHNK